MNTPPHVALITGGATGIGLALARKFHAAGHGVILVGRTPATLAQAAQTLPGARWCAADVSLARDRERLVAEFPEVSVLVNNAGVQHNATVLASTPEDLERELQINFLAPALLTRAFLPQLLNQPEAAIVNVSSALALVPKPSAAMYCASKAALHSFSTTLRWQLEGSRVRVFELLPPLVDTAMTAGRGRGKLSADQVAEAFWDGFQAQRPQVLVGKARVLALLSRLAPSVAERIMRREG